MVGLGLTARVGGGAPCWSGTDRGGVWYRVHAGPGRIGEEVWYRMHRSGEVGCSTSSVPTSPKRPESDGIL